MFSRVSYEDNISRNLSSFEVEMTEIRNILKRANTNSLILSDETARGTETVSALAITSAIIDTLTRAKINFIFTTHLHALAEFVIYGIIANVN